MSSTNRSSKISPTEFYPTPPWPVHAVLDAIPDLPNGLWVEPAIGDGAIVRAVEAHRPGRQNWIGFDIRNEAIEACRDRIDPALRLDANVFTADFLKLPLGFPEGVSVFITNPPFSKAEAFARACLERANGQAHVLLLLRLAFLETQTRVAFHRDYPADIYPLARRPSFVTEGEKKGQTDSCAYAWFYWGPGRGGRWFTPIGGINFTPGTSARERAAAS